MKINKQFFLEKILPILITSICSALISILSNIIAQYAGSSSIHADPVVAGGIGMVCKAIHQA